MSEQAGEKTEQATPRRLEEALKKGQFARSAEIQTVFVLCAGLVALRFTGGEIWQRLAFSCSGIFEHLKDINVAEANMRSYFLQGLAVFALCVGPIVICTMIGGLLAGGIQSRFNTASEALEPDWNRVNPMNGFKRMFSMKALTPAGLAMLKLMIIGSVCWTGVNNILKDPIFFTVIDAAQIARFLADSAGQLATRVILVLMAIAAGDYAYQYWQTTRDMMMTKEEVKEEMKNMEGDPHVKARQRRRRTMKSQRQMQQEVPHADVVLTNPTHIAVALRYDRKTMKAPKVVAKGTRLNAQKIREIARQHQVPVIENKPLARMLFKYAKVGGEIPAELYAAVAEILAHVYRVNRYRYYSEQNQN